MSAEKKRRKWMRNEMGEKKEGEKKDEGKSKISYCSSGSRVVDIWMSYE